MLNEPSLDAVTPEQISAWAAAKGLTSATAQERDVGAFGTTKGIVLSERTYKAFFPKIPATGNAEWELKATSGRQDRSAVGQDGMVFTAVGAQWAGPKASF